MKDIEFKTDNDVYGNCGTPLGRIEDRWNSISEEEKDARIEILVKRFKEDFKNTHE